MAQPLGDQQIRTEAQMGDLLRVVAGADAAGTVAKTCSCGHGRTAHEHYRRGTDCALCRCRKYHRPLLTRLASLRH